MGAQNVSITVIRPSSGWSLPRIGAAWQRRELLYFLALRDVKVRYSQTVLGVAWTILQPLVLMAVFTLAFRKIGRVETAGTPYPVFALAGLTFWSFFARSLSQGADSLVNNAQLVTKTASPRLLIPAAAIASGLVDLAIALGFFFVFATAYGEAPGWEVVFLPALILYGIVLAIGPTLLLSALNVKYRDVRFVLPFLVQVWLFLSPIAYPLDTLGDPWQQLAALNPLVGVVEGFRWALAGTAPPDAFAVAASVGVTAVLAAAGVAYFGRTERTLADRI